MYKINSKIFKILEKEVRDFYFRDRGISRITIPELIDVSIRKSCFVLHKLNFEKINKVSPKIQTYIILYNSLSIWIKLFENLMKWTIGKGLPKYKNQIKCIHSEIILVIFRFMVRRVERHSELSSNSSKCKSTFSVFIQISRYSELHKFFGKERHSKCTKRYVYNFQYLRILSNHFKTLEYFNWLTNINVKAGRGRGVVSIYGKRVIQFPTRLNLLELIYVAPKKSKFLFNGCISFASSLLTEN